MQRIEAVKADAIIRKLAAEQHGAVARPQLVDRGLSRWQIRHRLGTGRLTRLHRGVYGVGPVPGVLQREMAAALACGPGAVVSHWSAAYGWELTRAREGRAVAISVPRDVRLNDTGIRVFRTLELADDEATSLDGLHLTTPARTLFDLSGWVSDGELRRAVVRAVPRLVDPADIQALLRRYPRRRGRKRLRRLMEIYGDQGLTRSEAEREFLRVLRSGGLPLPETNVFVAGYEVDCLWRDARLIVEIDGRAYHSDATAFQGDRERDAALTAAGYRVVRATWKRITDHPRKLLVQIAQALTR